MDEKDRELYQQDVEKSREEHDVAEDETLLILDSDEDHADWLKKLREEEPDDAA